MGGRERERERERVGGQNYKIYSELKYMSMYMYVIIFRHVCINCKKKIKIQHVHVSTCIIHRATQFRAQTYKHAHVW